MSDAPKDFTPWFIEFFALACAFGCIDSIREHGSYKQIVAFAIISLVLAVFGFRWTWIKAWVSARWNARSLKLALAENAALKKQLAERDIKLAVAGIAKPEHNVQYTGFVVFDDEDFFIATLAFANVPNGKLLGKFEMPRLRVIYYIQSTGEEIADMFPAEWWSDGGPTIDIGAQEQCAVIASFPKGLQIWNAVEQVENENTGQLELNSKQIPTGSLHIVATLSGDHNRLRIPPVEGILTLGKDGTATFQQTKGYIEAI